MMDVSVKKCQQLVLPMLVVVLSMTACRSVAKFDVAGIYVNSAKSEFSIAHDTLRIIKGQRVRLFHIERRTGIRLIAENGKIGEEILESENWLGEFDAERGVLLEGSKGRSMVISPASLTLESAVYRRLP